VVFFLSLSGLYQSPNLGILIKHLYSNMQTGSLDFFEGKTDSTTVLTAKSTGQPTSLSVGCSNTEID
jgi:hypothetical protein